MQNPTSNTNPLDLTTGVGSFDSASFVASSGESLSPETVAPQSQSEIGEEHQFSVNSKPPFVQGADRYRTIGELGRGGWGYVLEACDEQLGRPVAVKQISGSLANREAIHQRFLHEAKITGQLQHPGIVPVHELGVADDGNPFYVMKLLEGVTFKETIAEIHGSGESLPDGYSIELLERFVDVCNAVAFAHERSIIHRDLKPANIMVGNFGETIVVDWGLAKQLSDESVDEAAALAEATVGAGQSPANPLPPSSVIDATVQPGEGSSIMPSRRPRASKVGNSDSHTRQGAILGTPAYMSPEQSRGEVHSLTPATDIYALGVILYEVLTSENPFRAGDIETTLSRVQSGEYRPPRAVKKGVPKALTAICETAMARRPEDRYASAQLIVKDIQCFLANEPVSVYDEPLWVRVTRWCKRRPALTAGILGSIVVLTICSVVFSAIIHRAHKAEQRARRKAVDAQQQALMRLAESRRASDAWLVDLSGALQFYPGMEGMRQQLLQQAIDHYEQLSASLASQTGDNLESGLESAKCSIRLGDLHRLLGNNDESWEHYHGAEKLLAPSGQTQLGFDNGKLRRERHLEAINVRIGHLLLDKDANIEVPAAVRLSEIEDDVHWLRRQLDSSKTGEGDAASLQLANALCRLQLASSRSTGHDATTIMRQLTEAETWATFLVEHRGQPRDHQLLQTIRDENATACEQSGRFAEAARIWRDEVSRMELLIEVTSNRPDLLQSRAFAAMKYAGSLTRLGQEAGARTFYRAAATDLERAWQLTDADAYYQRNRAISAANLGLLTANETARHGEAERLLGDAIEHLGQAVAADGPAVNDLVRLAECYESLGRIAARKGELSALELLDRAAQCFEVISDHGALTSLITAKRARMFACRTDALLMLGRADEASSELTKAQQFLGIARSDETLNAVEHSWIERLAAHLMDLEALVLDAEGEHEAASRQRDLQRSTLERLATSELNQTATQEFPRATLMLVDHLLERETATRRNLESAAAWLDKMRTTQPTVNENFDWQQRRALVQYSLGNYPVALEAIGQADKLRPGDPLTSILDQATKQLQGDSLAEESMREIQDLGESLPSDRRLQFWIQKLSAAWEE